MFNQEYLAQFIENSAGAFRYIHRCVKGTLEKPQSGHLYVIGWDIAKYSDFSVMTVVDVERKHVVAFDRFNGIDYMVQLQRLKAIAMKYNNAQVIMDSTGPGDPLLEHVKDSGLHAEGINFTNSTKQQLIQNLELQIENEEVSFPEIQELINELSMYKYEITKAGNATYAAPSGYHDDCVISLALAVWWITQRVVPTISSWDIFGRFHTSDRKLNKKLNPELYLDEYVEEAKRDLSRVWIPILTVEKRRRNLRNILLDHEEILQAPRDEQENALFTLMFENKKQFTERGFDVEKL